MMMMVFSLLNTLQNQKGDLKGIGHKSSLPRLNQDEAKALK
jgi:hypothetical protein